MMSHLQGSGPTGSKIWKKAAKYFKKVSLELGGKSPYIVLDDVDIKEAAKESATGKVVNNTWQFMYSWYFSCFECLTKLKMHS